MARILLHATLIVALLGSPFACCCSRAAHSPEKAASPGPSGCCCKSQPVEQTSDTEQQVPGTPQAPHPGGCPCKQKQPRALTPTFNGADLRLAQSTANELLVFTASATPQVLHVSVLPADAATPLHWFQDAQAMLRALQILRL